MEFLKNYFGDEAITYNQLAEKMGKDSNVKLANLAKGEYVSLEKYKAVVAEKNALRDELLQAETGAESENEQNFKTLQEQAEEYKQQAQETRKVADAELRELRYAMAIQEQCMGIEFSSASAKRAFMDALQQKQLEIKDGKIIELETFTEEWRKSDPLAFTQKSAIPRFVAPAEPPKNNSGWREKIGLNYQNAKQEVFD